MSGESVTLSVGAEPIELGRPVPLTVVRTWRRDQTPPEWSDASLAPFTVALREATRRELAGAVEETRRYDAWLFERGEVVVAPPGTAPLRLQVASALPEAERARPGPPELPSGLLREAEPRLLSPLVGAGAFLVLLVAALLIARRRSRRRRAPPTPAPARPTAAERALGRLRPLAANDPKSPDEIARDCLEGAAILRDYLDEGFGLPAPRRTTEELREAARARLASALAPIELVLSTADLVKFAAHRVEPGERAAVLRDVEVAVMRTAGGAGAP